MKIFGIIFVSIIAWSSVSLAKDAKVNERKLSSTPTSASIACADQDGLLYVIHATPKDVSLKIVGRAKKFGPTDILKTGVEVKSTGFKEAEGFFFPIGTKAENGIFIGFMDQSSNDGFKELKIQAPEDIFTAIKSSASVIRTWSTYAAKLEHEGNMLTGGTGACFLQ